MTRAVLSMAALGALLCATPAEAQPTREVTVSARSVVSIDTKLRYTTMLILPEGEDILDIICGDKDFWIVSGVQNFAYVKPAKAGAATNLNLVARSGTVYSFVLTEGAASPDLKVFVLPDRPLVAPGVTPDAKATEALERARQEAQDARLDRDAARSELLELRAHAAQAVEDATHRVRARYPTELRFPYRFKADAKPFRVSAIFHDGQSTFIRLEATELPAVYELKDGAASLVNLQAQDGLLIVPKVIEIGYLALGKQRLFFHTREK
jgi:type IV secretory pathway VirB9-like protein